VLSDQHRRPRHWAASFGALLISGLLTAGCLDRSGWPTAQLENQAIRVFVDLGTERFADSSGIYFAVRLWGVRLRVEWAVPAATDPEIFSASTH